MATTGGTQSRRALLSTGLGALAASVLAALGRPLDVHAEGQAVQVGGEYTDATSQTLIQNQTNAESVIVAQAGPGGTALVGIGGATGVAGSSSSGTGVYASSTSAKGVDASSTTGVAVNAVAVTGIAVSAFGNSSGATAIRAEAAPFAIAIEAHGPVKLSTSGVATIPANQTSVTFAAGADITADSFLLLTPKVNIAGRTLWFTTDAIQNTVTIRMNRSRTKATGVSWLLLNQLP